MPGQGLALRPIAQSNSVAMEQIVEQAAFKKRKISNWRAKRLAALYDRTIKEHKTQIADLRTGWGMLIRFHTSLTDVYIYKSKKLRIATFIDSEIDSLAHFLIMGKYRDK